MVAINIENVIISNTQGLMSFTFALGHMAYHGHRASVINQLSVINKANFIQIGKTFSG